MYILNALYLAPITLWTYLKYGRPEKPMKMAKGMDMGGEKKTEASETPHAHHDMSGHDHTQMKMDGGGHDMSGHDHTQMKMGAEHHHMSGEIDMNHGDHHHHEMDHEGGGSQIDHAQHAHHDITGMNHTHHDMEAVHKPEETHTENDGPGHEKPSKPHDMSHMDHGAMNHRKMHNMHMPSADQPMFPTVTIAVCHCGAGCLLGDIVGEWLVFGTNATLGGRSIGPEFLIGIPSLLHPSLTLL